MQSKAALVDAFADAAAGAAGGLVSTVVLYPVDLAKTRVQSETSALRGSRPECPAKFLHSRTLAVLVRLLRQHGLVYLFRGLEAKSVQAVTGSFIYFYSYSFCKDMLRRCAGGKTKVSLNLLAAALAGAVNVLITLPIENVTTQMQTDSGSDDSSKSLRRPMSLADVTQDLYCETGVQRFWRGLPLSLTLTCHPAINYTVYDSLKAAYIRRLQGNSGEHIGPLAAFCLAALAKAVATIITYPLIRAKVVMMAAREDKGSPKAPCAHSPPSSQPAPGQGAQGCRTCASQQAGGSMSSAVSSIMAEDGLWGFYTGCGGQLVHTILKSALLLATKEEIARATKTAVWTIVQGRPVRTS